MVKFEHILFPVDFSPQVDATVPYVASLARKFSAKVTLLSVVPPIWAGRGPKPDYADELEISTKKRLAGALTAEVHGLTVERAVVSGEPAEGILAYAKARAVDLIMMPTHGYGVFRSLLIGSVTAKVLHDAPCAVWTAAHTAEQRVEQRAEQRAEHRARQVPEKIICSVDGGPNSVAQMRWAAEFSARLGARLLVLHAVPSVADWSALLGDREIQEEELSSARKRIEAQCLAAGLAEPPYVAVGPISEIVAAQVVAERADLLIIGRGQAGAAFGRLRTHAYDIIRSSQCPVLSV